MSQTDAPRSISENIPHEPKGVPLAQPSIPVAMKAGAMTKQVSGDLKAPRYVKLQCAEFLRMWDGQDPVYMVDEAKLVKVCQLLRLLKMAKRSAPPAKPPRPNGGAAPSPTTSPSG